MNTAEFDVAVIGAGAAGATAAVVAAEAGVRVALLSKDPVGYGNTRISGGEMASSGLTSGDSPIVLLRDMVVGGEFINDVRLAEVVANEASVANRLVESFGQVFRRGADGKLTPDEAARPGGHQYHRSLFSPARGKSMGHALRAAIARSHITVYEDTMVTKLLVHSGEIQGLVAIHLGAGVAVLIKAKAVVMATGGAGGLYFPRATGMRTVAGDGLALALNEGAELINMEMVQFIPFTVARPGSMMTGIELGDPDLAGPEGKLINNRGDIVLEHLDNMTRAEVSRVIALEVEAGRAFDFGGLLLDLSGNLALQDQRQKRERENEKGRNDKILDILGRAAYEWREPWPVVPSVHYHMGGIRIEPDAQSVNVRGLFAAGEAQGATYGANRLGSTSLAEAFVFGRVAGESAAQRALLAADGAFDCQSEAEIETARIEALFGAEGSHRPVKLKHRLHEIAAKKIGILRDEEKLQAALAEIGEIEACVEDVRVGSARRYNLEVLDALELPLMARTARAIAMSALIRMESRGAHLRRDFAEKDDETWRKFTVVKDIGGALRVWGEDIPPWPAELVGEMVRAGVSLPPLSRGQR